MKVRSVLAITVVLSLMTSGSLDAQVPWWEWPGKWVSSKFRKAKLGKLAPVYLGNTLDGEPRNLEDYEGKVVLAEFWAPWCPPCGDALEKLADFRRANPDTGMEVLAINVLTKRENLDAHLKDHRLDLIYLHDPKGRVSGAYGVVSLPQAVLIDESGIVLRKWKGATEIAQLDQDLAPFFTERRRTLKEESG